MDPDESASRYLGMLSTLQLRARFSMRWLHTEPFSSPLSTSFWVLRCPRTHNILSAFAGVQQTFRDISLRPGKNFREWRDPEHYSRGCIKISFPRMQPKCQLWARSEVYAGLESSSQFAILRWSQKTGRGSVFKLTRNRSTLLPDHEASGLILEPPTLLRDQLKSCCLLVALQSDYSLLLLARFQETNLVKPKRC